MDILYLYKRHDKGRELRYSLRSLKHMPHDRVFVAGDPEPWMENIKMVQIRSIGYHAKNALNSLIYTLEDSDLADDFVLFHDDMFLLKPVRTTGICRGNLEQVIESMVAEFKRRSIYIRNCERTLEYLRKWVCPEPLSYHLHRPMRYNRQKLLETILETKEREPLWTSQQYHTIYFNKFPPVETYIVPDVKIRTDNLNFDFDVLSSAPKTIDLIQEILDEQFSLPCRYEKEFNTDML